jgi:uncharacterized membrane protein
MIFLLPGLVIFFTLHSLAFVAPRWREQKRQRWGRATWRWITSVGSILAVLLIAYGYQQSRYAPVVLYVSPGWLRRVTDLLMLPVFPMVYATFLPSRIRSTLRYPDLVAIKLWAVAHLLVNGMLADLILFGSFLAWAVVNRISLKRRVRIVPSAAPSPYNDLVAIVLGLFTYLCIVFYLHYKIIGVIPF